MTQQQGTATPEHRFCTQCGASLYAAGLEKPVQFCGACGKAQYSLPQALSERQIHSSRRTLYKKLGVAGLIVIALGLGSFSITRLFIDSPAPAQANASTSSGNQQAAAAPLSAEIQATLARLQDSLALFPLDKNLILRTANALYDAGSAYQQANAVFLAKTTFAKAEVLYAQYLRDFDSANTGVRVDYAYSLLSQGKEDEAINQTKKALEFEPEHPIALYNLGVIYFRKQNFAEARVWLEKAKKAAPDSEVARGVDAVLQQMTGKTGGS